MSRKINDILRKYRLKEKAETNEKELTQDKNQTKNKRGKVNKKNKSKRKKNPTNPVTVSKTKKGKKIISQKPKSRKKKKRKKTKQLNSPTLRRLFSRENIVTSTSQTKKTSNSITGLKGKYSENKIPEKEAFPSLTAPIKLSFSGEVKKTDWNVLTFNNGFIDYTYQNMDFKILENRSIYYLNWIKELFAERKYTFTIRFVEGKPTRILFNESIFDNIELSKIIFAHKNFEHLGNNTKVFLDIKRLGISFKRLFSLFDISKKYYIEFLCKLHSDTQKLLVILEPIFQYKEFIRNDLSFLFVYENGEELVAIWESTYYDKATYLFYYDSIEVPSKKDFLNYLADFLCRQEPKKRYNLRCKNYTIKGVKTYKSVNHSYLYSEDEHWKNNITQSLV